MSLTLAETFLNELEISYNLLLKLLEKLRSKGKLLNRNKRKYKSYNLHLPEE